MSVLNRHEADNPTDTELVRATRVWAGSGNECPRKHLLAVADRLSLRSRQLNNVLYRIAVAAGFNDVGGTVRADPEDIVAAVERRLSESHDVDGGGS